MKKMFAIAGVVNYLIFVFLNAFTDLGHKIIIQNTVFKIYDAQMQIILTAIVNALILLPFILVFSPSGFLADKFAKHKIMQYSAFFAVVITLFITYAYYHGMFEFAFVLTFILALQSAIYSPAKYGYIKELVGDKFITQGNGAVQAVTTVAILGGIIFYSAFFESMVGDKFKTSAEILEHIAPLGWFLVGGSLIEFYFAMRLKDKRRAITSKRFRLKKYLQGGYLYKNIKIIKRKKDIFDVIVAISVLWSISQVILAIFGEYAKSKLGVTNAMEVQGVMALSGFGIVFGSFLASTFSKYFINMGLAFVGAVILTISVFLVPLTHSMAVLSLLFLAIGIATSLILVPLNAYIQAVAPNVHLGVILAGNNFIQNIFMIVFLALTTLFAYFGMDSEVLFFLMGFAGVYLVYIISKKYFVVGVWAFFTMIFSFRYKIIYEGLENIPAHSGVLLLGNHVSWIDWLFLQVPIRRRINYLMDKDIYNYKIFNATLKKGEVIPISPKSFKDAFKDASKRLKNGRILAIFPEGEISKDGKIHQFKKGYELLSKNKESVIVPFYIDGAFGSVFSKYKPKNSSFSFPRRVIKVIFSKPVPIDTPASELENIVKNLKG